VATPHREDSLAKAVGRTHFLYTQYLNALHGRSGHLWQGRFHSCALDKPHLWAVLRYIERNPVRARLVRKAWLYKASSAAAHTGGPDRSGLLDLRQWEREWSPEDWKQTLCNREDVDAMEQLRLGTSRGRPLGSDRFINKLERSLGRRLRPLPVGRPRKRDKK